MDKAQTDKKQRKFPRIPKEYPIKVAEIAFPLKEGAGKTGFAKNVSGSGICFIVSSPYKPKTLINLKIDMVGWQRHKKNVSSVLDSISAVAPLSAIAEVVWCEKLSNSAEYEIGVKFLDIYEDDYEALKKYLDEILS